MKQNITLLLIAFTTLLSAQETGSIVGKLTDKDYNNNPLPFANVLIKGTTIGTTSDDNGLYAIENLAAGVYTVTCSFVGYETVEINNVKVESGKVTEVHVPLGASAAALDEVVIKTTSKRESVIALLLEQKNAAIIKQSIGAEELSQKGVSDAAGAITKISGISRQEGGTNVYVRGLGDRYLNTTYNGLTLPSNNIEKKNIDLQLFSSDIIQNVSVSKAYATEFYGDFAAGNVNILAKDATSKSFLDVSIGSGTNSRAGEKEFVKGEGIGYFGFYNRYNNNPFAVILSHGVDPVSTGEPLAFEGTISGNASLKLKDTSRLSLFFTASFENDFEYRNGQAVDFTTVEKKRFPSAEEYEYSTTTNAMTNLKYSINNNHTLRINSLFINNASNEVGYYGIDGKGSNRDAILDTDKGFYQMNAQFTQDMIFVNQLTGLHKIDDQFEIDWGIGHNSVFSRQPDRKRFSVERYDLALDNDPATLPSFYNNIPYDNQRYFQNIKDEELNSRFNVAYDASSSLKFNFGYNGRTKERQFNNIRYGYDFIQPNTPVVDINNLNEIFKVENLGVVYNTEVFNAIYPEGGIDNTNYPGRYENTYTGNLDIHAGYINAEISAGEKWLLVPGFRIESFDQEIVYDVINLPSSDAGFRATNKNFYLPSFSVTYRLTDSQNLRFAASKTVSFPEFKEVAPFVYEDVTQRVGGNPDLLNDPSFSEIYNLDLKYEWFFGKGEILSLAGFAKQINDPINKVIANDATGTQRYFRTGEKAEVVGGEIELRKAILVGQDSAPELSVGFNATYMFTRQDLKDSNGLFSTTFNKEEEELQGASPLLLNADISYRPILGTYKPMVNLVYSYFSDRIDAIGSGQLGNIIEKQVSSLDFVWKNSLSDSLEINASAKNLLDPSIERIRENTSQGDVILSQYKRGIDLAVQLKYTF
ncbi:TonB-dependent receptor [Ulvibacter sp. MAR_2010_11]|uniref:TonB-dependent receptor n=1 Tax=Ulvibacter sp. MAR_2010_11 TaxID=1250229 RepID=UPI000C2C7224|nr:TonB-dependent receptor [Ulvibacter sp. MAR_2010_11]PKA83160.1 TonB-dependent receptor [Ulvibacter sp. MAR_2010_11]